MKSVTFRFAMALIIIALFVLNVNSIRRMLNTSPAPVSASSSADLDHWEIIRARVMLCQMLHSSREELMECVDKIEPVLGGLQLGDCDDNDPTVFPGAPELCDGKDNNGIGGVDESCIPTQMISVPDFDQVRSITWHIPEGVEWIPPVRSEQTNCGDDRQSLVGGGFDVVVPEGTTVEASFTKEEKMAMEMLGYRPDCLYWSSVDFDSRARLLPNNVWVCEPLR